MAHHEDEATPIEHVLEVLTEHGLEGMAEAIQTLMNAAMKLERSEFLRASPGERSGERIGHANGFKGRRVKSRVGELALRVPRVRAAPEVRGGLVLPEGAGAWAAERADAQAGDRRDVCAGGLDPARHRDHA